MAERAVRRGTAFAQPFWLKPVWLKSFTLKGFCAGWLRFVCLVCQKEFRCRVCRQRSKRRLSFTAVEVALRGPLPEEQRPSLRTEEREVISCQEYIEAVKVVFSGARFCWDRDCRNDQDLVSGVYRGSQKMLLRNGFLSGAKLSKCPRGCWERAEAINMFPQVRISDRTETSSQDRSRRVFFRSLCLGSEVK